MKKRVMKIVLVALLLMQGSAFALGIHPITMAPLFKSPKIKGPALPTLRDSFTTAPAKPAPQRYNLLMERLLSERDRHNAIRTSS